MNSCFLGPCVGPRGGPPKVAYVTDPEGNLSYFDLCISMAKGVHLKAVDEEGVRKDIHLEDGWVLVVRSALPRGGRDRACASCPFVGPGSVVWR